MKDFNNVMMYALSDITKELFDKGKKNKVVKKLLTVKTRRLNRDLGLRGLNMLRNTNQSKNK